MMKFYICAAGIFFRFHISQIPFSFYFFIQDSRQKQHISFTFSDLIGISSKMTSCSIYLGQHQELANLCPEVCLVASMPSLLQLMQMH